MELNISECKCSQCEKVRTEMFPRGELPDLCRELTPMTRHTLMVLCDERAQAEKTRWEIGRAAGVGGLRDDQSDGTTSISGRARESEPARGGRIEVWTDGSAHDKESPTIGTRRGRHHMGRGRAASGSVSDPQGDAQTNDRAVLEAALCAMMINVMDRAVSCVDLATDEQVGTRHVDLASSTSCRCVRRDCDLNDRARSCKPAWCAMMIMDHRTQ